MSTTGSTVKVITSFDQANEGRGVGDGGIGVANAPDQGMYVAVADGVDVDEAKASSHGLSILLGETEGSANAPSHGFLESYTDTDGASSALPHGLLGETFVFT